MKGVRETRRLCQNQRRTTWAARIPEGRRPSHQPPQRHSTSHAILRTETPDPQVLLFQPNHFFAAILRRVAKWLRRNGLVGITELGDRVFLFSESREKLSASGAAGD